MSAAPPDTIKERIGPFLDALARSGYRGEIARDGATRSVFATDNSIYRLVPAAVLYPREPEDLNRIVALANSAEYGPIPLAPRGGGTGTNGQSLSRGVVVDTSRHLNRIEALDLEAGLVTVEPGVVLGQLNAFLAPHGLFFPPSVSTASRATLGGMVATDASGKGSRLYGKTSDYIHAMEVVLAGGETWRCEPLSADELDAVAAKETLPGRIHREVRRVVTEQRERIAEVFPAMNRGLTGYNLKSVLGEDGRFRLSYLLAGSEGTLALTQRLVLKVRRKPAHSALVGIRYATFEAALGHVQRLIAADPAAVEILDDKILALARQDIVWADLEAVLGGVSPVPVGGLNVVEFVGETVEAVEEGVARLSALLAAGAAIAIDWAVVREPKTIAQLWSLREKSVGLLGRLGGSRQGTAFVEDTAVPAEKLADYVAEFRAILDRRGLSYGMFGHADVGCLHVRPALDMKDPADAALIRPISDEVAALTRNYAGLLWGEHGRGFRGEYSPFFFGAELYGELCRLKAVFDPNNIFNPGKLAAPDGRPLDRIDEVPFRGAVDRTIPAALAEEVKGAIACNGNGACFNWDAFDPMCPSYKATRDRVQSPKGRASLLRDWARLEGGAAGGDELQAVEEALHASLATCLSCKACSSQCPVKVDIPAMKAQFFDRYYRRRGRPLRHRLVAQMEAGLALARRLPGLANAVMRSKPAAALLARVFGLIDLPALAPAPRARPLSRSLLAGLAALPAEEKSRAVILVEDSFTSTFDGTSVEAVQGLLTQLGYTVHREPPRPNGKALHVLGMLGRFSRIAAGARTRHAELAAAGLVLVGIEPVTLLMAEHEYREVGVEMPVRVRSVDEFLADEIAAGRIAARAGRATAPYRLFLHCSEKTARPRAASQWAGVFRAFGLSVETPATGCCGMAGLFGHEREHAGLSKQLFAMSWQPRLSGVSPAGVLATGFSCRCQTERLAGFRPRHPAEVLLEHLADASHTPFHTTSRENPHVPRRPALAADH